MKIGIYRIQSARWTASAARQGSRADVMVAVRRPHAHWNIRPVPCPRCGCARVAPILYGYPALLVHPRDPVETGMVAIGGCVSWENQPAWCCRRCGESFGADGEQTATIRRIYRFRTSYLDRRF